MSPEAQAAVQAWLGQPVRWQALAGDASRRSYHRMTTDDQRWMVMDASQEPESLQQFLPMHDWLQRCGVPVPRVHVHLEAHHALILDDLGDTTLLGYQQQHDDAAALYDQVMAQWANWQRHAPEKTLNDFLSLAEQELAWFPDQWCHRWMKAPLSEQERADYQAVVEAIMTVMREQPQVPIHRDFHSRNLMVYQDQLYWLDFQDAMMGPVTYDVVSLIKDAYVVWDEEHVQQWSKMAWQGACLAGLAVSEDDWCRWIDWTGLQRHLKILGLFPRLILDQGKSGFEADLPRLVHYIITVSRRYEALQPLCRIMESRCP